MRAFLPRLTGTVLSEHSKPLFEWSVASCVPAPRRLHWDENDYDVRNSHGKVAWSVPARCQWHCYYSTLGKSEPIDQLGVASACLD
jgi:hypothetical protein